MDQRHHLPTRWLMTDERFGRALWSAIARLPRGAGIVFRHHATAADKRRRLFALLLRRARPRGVVVVAAGDFTLRGEQGSHNRRGRGLVTASVHDHRDGRAARALRADLVFVSPVFATRSHPGQRALGVVRARRLAIGQPIAAIALGGMDERRFRRLRGFAGWAAIDAWTRPSAGQKRKAVPT